MDKMSYTVPTADLILFAPSEAVATAPSWIWNAYQKTESMTAMPINIWDQITDSYTFDSKND